MNAVLVLNPNMPKQHVHEDARESENLARFRVCEYGVGRRSFKIPDIGW